MFLVSGVAPADPPGKLIERLGLTRFPVCSRQQAFTSSRKFCENLRGFVLTMRECYAHHTLEECIKVERWTLKLPSCQASKLVPWLVSGVLALSITGKLIRPGSTLSVLTSVWCFNADTARTIFVALLLVEASVLMLLLVGGQLGFAVAVCFLAVVTLSPIRQFIESSHLGCGCGLLPDFLQPRHQQLISVFTNMGMCLSLWLA